MLYFGDDDMTRAAAYLCGIMTYHGIPFVRIDSAESPTDVLLQEPCDAFIISDYPRERFQPGQLEMICAAVKNGAGLVMLGGWESFHGRLGEYHETVLADVLPVKMLNKDDRRNFSQGVILALMSLELSHPITDGLPWINPPLVGGLNKFSPKRGATVLLKGQPLEVLKDDDEWYDFDFNSPPYPMLVVGEYGKGRTAAFATDVAPHWAGGMVDWGKKRITQDLPNGGFVEIGVDYAKFFAQLLRWVAG